MYAPLTGTRDGAIFYVIDGRIEVRRFDGTALKIAGDPRSIGFAAGQGSLYYPVMLSASSDVLAFAESAIPSGDRLEAVDRRGGTIRTWNKPEALDWPRVSAGGRLLARQVVDAVRNNPDIWVDDSERGTSVRVTTAPEPDIQAVWSPDDRLLAYVSGNLPARPGKRTLSIAAADGTGVVRTFPCPAAYCEPTDWSRDGLLLLVNVQDARGSEVWTVSTQDGSARPLFTGGSAGRDARFSPDGRWIVYVSKESGRSEVSVRALVGPSARIVLSSGGGDQPVWRRDGAELFFVDPQGTLQSVSVRWDRDGSPRFGLPTRMNLPPVGFAHWGTQYDVTSDGERVYLLRENRDPAPRELHVVMGWRALLDNQM